MTQKGDFIFQGGLAKGDEAEKIEFSSAYAISDHFAVMGNTCFYHNNNSTGRGTLLEGGVGYYAPLQNEKWIVETYAGFGYGQGNNSFDSEQTYFKLNRYFIQPDLGFSTKYFDAIVSVRGAFVITAMSDNITTRLVLVSKNLTIHSPQEAAIFWWNLLLYCGWATNLPNFNFKSGTLKTLQMATFIRIGYMPAVCWCWT